VPEESVEARLGTASWVTVSRTSRLGGRERKVNTTAAPLAAPSMRPSARKANSLPFKPVPNPFLGCPFDEAPGFRA
jgi:hypothetical protein